MEIDATLLAASSTDSRSTPSLALSTCKRAAFCSVDCALLRLHATGRGKEIATLHTAVSTSLPPHREAHANENAHNLHLTIDVNSLDFFLVFRANALTGGLHGSELPNVEVLLGLNLNLVRLVIGLLLDERDHLLDLLFDLRVVHGETCLLATIPPTRMSLSLPATCLVAFVVLFSVGHAVQYRPATDWCGERPC